MTLDSCQCGVWGMLFGVCSVCVLRWSTRMTARSPHPVRPCRCPCGEQKDDTDICNEYFVGVGYMLVAVLVVAFLLGVFVAYLAVKGGCKVCARHHTSKGGRGATPLPSFGAGAVGHARRCGVGDGGGVGASVRVFTAGCGLAPSGAPVDPRRDPPPHTSPTRHQCVVGVGQPFESARADVSVLRG